MPIMSRQAKLMNKEERKVRGIRLGSKARVGGSRATRLGVSPEIRSLQKGRIKLGSVAPLLSSRAKALAVKEHYKCYSDDEAHHLSDKSGDSSFSENDYGDEFYDVDRDHRSYGSCRTHFHAKSHDELEPSSSFPSPISALVEAPRARKSATITSVSASTKLNSSSKLKKNSAHSNPKDKNKIIKGIKRTSRSGAITRSQRL